MLITSATLSMEEERGRKEGKKKDERQERTGYEGRRDKETKHLWNDMNTHRYMRETNAAQSSQK